MPGSHFQSLKSGHVHMDMPDIHYFHHFSTHFLNMFAATLTFAHADPAYPLTCSNPLKPRNRKPKNSKTPKPQILKPKVKIAAHSKCHASVLFSFILRWQILSGCVIWIWANVWVGANVFKLFFFVREYAFTAFTVMQDPFNSPSLSLYESSCPDCHCAEG